MDPYHNKPGYPPNAPPNAPPSYWEHQQSDVAINQPGMPYPQYPPSNPNQPLLPPQQQQQSAYPGQPYPPQQYHPHHQGYQQYGATPQQHQPPGPSGYQPVPAYPSTGQAKPSVVIVGGCPACRIGVLEDDFTCLGVCCAIFLFPIGILCCLAMRQRRCPNCGANFS